MTENITPAQLTPVVHAVDGVDPALVEIGRRYWNLAGFDEETGYPRWVETASAICHGRPYVVAAAAVRAVLPDIACPVCHGPLSLTSRAELQKIITGQAPTKCVDCDPTLRDHAARILAPSSNVRSRVDQQAQQQRAQRLRQLRRDEQTAILHEQYEIRMLPDTTIPAASVREEVITLALLSYAPDPAPLGPIDQWVDPLHPRVGQSSSCVAEALLAGLLRIHSDSPINSFVWEPESFEAACDALVPDLDDEEQIRAVTLTNRYYAAYAIHYTPYGHSLDTAAAGVHDHLSTRLDPAAMTKTRQGELRDLMIEVLAEEAIRYLEVLLDEHNLPNVPDNHRDRLKQAAYDIAATRSLGELYYLAWCSARDAATAAQRNPQASRLNMTVHGVNKFESRAREALDRTRELRRFNPKADLELAAITRTIFLRILGCDAFTTSVEDIEWPPPIPDTGESHGLPHSGHPVDVAGGTDFPHLHCSGCGDLVPAREAWMWVNVRDAFAYLHDSDQAQSGREHIEHLLNDHPARWGVGHSPCGPDGDALHEVRMPQTHREFLTWAADIIQSRWIGGTDLRALLTEAATYTSRFTNHTQ